MKTKTIFNVSKYIGLIMLVFIFSCSSDDDTPPSEANCNSLPSNLVGLYTGELSAGNFSDNKGTVTIKSVGNNDAGCPMYSATFSEEAINNDTGSVFETIVFKKDENKFIATQQSVGPQTFVIDTANNSLQIQVGSINFNGILGENTGGGDDTGNVSSLNLNIDKGVLYGLDVELTDKGTYNIPIGLGTNGTAFDETEEEFTGTGTVIGLDFYSNTPELAPGTYTLSDSEDAFTFEGDIFSVPEDDNKAYSVEVGTITVSYNGDDIVLTYDLSLDSDADTSTDIDATTKGSFTGELLQIGECFVTLPNSLLGTFQGEYENGSTGNVIISLNADDTYNITYSNGATPTANITFCNLGDALAGETEYTNDAGNLDITLSILSNGDIEIDIETPEVEFTKD